MNNKIKDLMMFYGVSLGERLSKSEKEVFYEEVAKRYHALGYAVSQDEESKNILIGDINKAKVLLTAGYETPTKSLISKTSYYPLNYEKNIKEEMRTNLVSIVGYIISFILVCIFVPAAKVKEVNMFLIVVLVLILFGITYLIFKKKANKLNFTRNSASLVALELIAEKNKNDNAAFLLLNETATSSIGFNKAKDILDNFKGIVVDLNCIASGETLAIACSRRIDSEAKEIVRKIKDSEFKMRDTKFILIKEEMIDNTPLKYHDNFVSISSGQLIDNTIVVENTRTKNDIKWDEEFIADFCDKLVGIIDEL